MNAQKPEIFVTGGRFNEEARTQNDHWASCTASKFALLVFFNKTYIMLGYPTLKPVLGVTLVS